MHNSSDTTLRQTPDSASLEPPAFEYLGCITLARNSHSYAPPGFIDHERHEMHERLCRVGCAHRTDQSGKRGGRRSALLLLLQHPALLSCISRLSWLRSAQKERSDFRRSPISQLCANRGLALQGEQPNGVNKALSGPVCTKLLRGCLSRH